MHLYLSRAIARAFHDLQVTGAPLPRVEESDWQTLPTAESAYLWSVDGSGMGVWIDIAVSEAERLAMLAEQVQDWAVEEKWATSNRATNWPPCPEHPRNHPLVAEVREDTAVWACPASGRRVTEIGQFSAPA